MSSYAKRVDLALTKLGVQYITEARFVACKNQRTLPFDFYVISHRSVIEVDGEFHFNPECKKLHENDKIKNEFCARQGIPLLRVNYKELKSMSDAQLKTRIQHFLNSPRSNPPVPINNRHHDHESKVTEYLKWNVIVLVLNVLLAFVNFF